MSAPLSPERLAEIAARAAAASPAPWETDTLLGPTGGIGVATEGDFDVWVIPVQDLDPADAAFIAHARQDVPALLAEVARLCGELASANESLETAAEALRLKGQRISEQHDDLVHALGRDGSGLEWSELVDLATGYMRKAEGLDKPKMVITPPASFVLQAMNRVPDSLPRCPVCTFAPAYCTCFGKTHRFDPERLGESDAKRRLANCVGCGQPRNAPCHTEAGDPR